MKETKEARFRRVAEARVNKLIRMPLSRFSRSCRSSWIGHGSDSPKMGSRDESGSLFRKRRRRTPFHIHTSRFLCRMARGCAPSAMQTRLIQPSIYIFYRMASRMS